MSDGVTVETVAELGADVGEGPVWLADTSELLWVDMEPGLLHRTRYDGSLTTSTTTTSTGLFLGAVVPRVDGGFVAATGTGFARLAEEGSVELEVYVLDAGFRMNDAKCDPAGRFWAGSTDRGFAPGRGALHILSPDWTSRVVLTGLTLPNGMGWSPAGDVFYLADTMTHEVFAYEVDPDTGLPGRSRLLHTFSDGDGMPDGLCMDDTGCLWVALWGGSAVACLTPDGERIRTVELPATQTSSCAFGGPDRDILFVTSAASGLDPTETGRNEGALFAVRGLGRTGPAPARFAG
ncbi:SMP-30/gluconolactonase/LRE family protein [Leifsonia poae]|uniref:SMP-30/gluconolactonase/LRE family protein n=1 Tax=Leifsonia poae TaxID=110933 RepID=UPI003D66B6DE